jgi:ATP/ADP translocase
VFVAWLVGLFNRVSFGLGWTVMIVYFVSNYGISSLPYLFFIHAGGTIIGSFLFSSVVNRFKKEHLLIGIVLAMAMVLAGASLLFSYNSYVYLGLVFWALSILHSQLKIVHSLFVEELFTPTQSNRVFPIVESSETFGIILGGLLVSSMSHVMPLNKFLYVWMLTILMIVPAVIVYMQHSIAIPFVDLVKGAKSESRFQNVKSVFQLSKKMKFLKSIVLIVFLQWAFFSVLEFQFTKAVEQSVKHTEEHTLVLSELNEFGKASVVIAQETHADPVEQVSDKPSVYKSTSYDHEEFEEKFASDLGNLQMLFGAVTLLFQLFLASRILSYLGVVGSMMVSPVVLIASVLFMMLRFGFGSAIVARFNHEIAHVLHTNAYHSSYYVLSHEMRANVKEFLEGFVRPLGAIAGTLGLFLITSFSTGELSTLIINIVALGILFVLLAAVLSLRSRYKEVPRTKLKESNSLNELIDAISIIRQNGDIDDFAYMMAVQIERDDLPLEVEQHLIRTFGDYGDVDYLSYLIDLISKRSDLKLEILRAINSIFARHHDEISDKPFTLFALKNLYEGLLQGTNDPLLKGEVISFVIMSNYHEGFVDKIVSLLDEDLDTETLKVCGSVLKNLDDKHLVNYVSQFLDHEDPKVRSVIIDVVWSHTFDKSTVVDSISSMLNSDDENAVLEALILIRNLDLAFEFENQFVGIEDKFDDVKIDFMIKLLGSDLGLVDYFYDYLYLDIQYADLLKVYDVVSMLNDSYVKKFFRRRVTSEIHDIYMHYNRYIDDTDSLSGVQAALLSKLRDLYRIIEAEREYFAVQEILRSR